MKLHYDTWARFGLERDATTVGIFRRLVRSGPCTVCKRVVSKIITMNVACYCRTISCCLVLGSDRGEFLVTCCNVVVPSKVSKRCSSGLTYLGSYLNIFKLSTCVRHAWWHLLGARKRFNDHWNREGHQSDAKKHCLARKNNQNSFARSSSRTNETKRQILSSTTCTALSWPGSCH